MIFLKSLRDANFDNNIRASRYAAVLFFANFCGPSRFAAEVFGAVSRAKKGVRFFTVDVDAEAHLARRCGIDAVPLILFFRGGVPICAIRKTPAQKQLLDMIDRLMR